MHNGLQNIFDIQSCFRGNTGRIVSLQTNHILYLRLHMIRVGAWKIDFIDNRKYVQIMIQSQIDICQRLSLNALGRIHYQDGSVAGCQTAGNLIIKVYMSGSVDQVKNIFLPVLCLIYGTHCLRFDGNASLPLQVHVVQDLLLHLSAC